MNIAAILDISTFLWDKAHHDANKNQYYSLMDTFPSILGKITSQKIPVLLRGELINEIQTYFPYDVIPSEYYDYQRLTLSYLTKLNMTDYIDGLDVNLVCRPSLVKDYFQNSTKDELNHLIAHVFKEDNTSYKVLTFSIFWPDKGNVNISNGKIKEVATTLCDNEEEHDTIVLSLKKIFIHNSKHDKFKSSGKEYYGKVISPIRCYDDRVKDSTKIQAILDASILIENDYYGYDADNKTYIRFECTEMNIYHGFEIEPEADLKLKLDKVFE